MLIPVITQYLETHKRLVIPQLGAFIVKEPGRAVLFSELLKRDDGVLRGLLCAVDSTSWRPPARLIASSSRCAMPSSTVWCARCPGWAR